MLISEIKACVRSAHLLLDADTPRRAYSGSADALEQVTVFSLFLAKAWGFHTTGMKLMSFPVISVVMTVKALCVFKI